MVKISKDVAKFLIEQSGGKMFTAKFFKKDGSERVMNCRTGVKKGVKGVGRKFDPQDHNLVGVYEVKTDGFRMINLNTLTQLNINKKQYEVV